MPQIRLAAQPRTEFGKGAARRLRAAGRVPAVLYGQGSAAQHFSFSAQEFARAIKGGANTVLTIEVEGTEQLALPRAIVRHPLRDYFEHVDLLTVHRGQQVAVEVPVHLVGEPEPGTLVLHDLTLLNIEVDALNIPDRIEVSIAGATAGTHITAGDVQLPAGATLVDAPDTLVVAVQAEVEVEEEPAATTTTEEAAPAAEEA